LPHQRVHEAVGRAVDSHDRWRVRHDEVDGPLAGQPAAEFQHLAIVDDGSVEAFTLPAYVNADPASHRPKPALPDPRF
jgi:hypothetical protein